MKFTLPESKIFQITGPPGCGKTYYLAKQAVRAARERGNDQVVIASLTRAAATEIKGRDLDVPEDLAMLRGIFEELYPANPAFGLSEILALLRARPDIAAMNAHVWNNA